MAVKNTETRIYNVEYETICSAFRDAFFSKLLDAEYIEEAILSDGVEFRYKRKTDVFKYGRNYFIKVAKVAEDSVSISVTTQSRKVTVLVDTHWKKEVDNVFTYIDAMLRR